MTQPPPLVVEVDDDVKQKIFTALDHYNAGAEALQQITAHHQDEDFGVSDAMVLIELARTHAEMGNLKFKIDRAKWECMAK